MTWDWYGMVDQTCERHGIVHENFQLRIAKYQHQSTILATGKIPEMMKSEELSYYDFVAYCRDLSMPRFHLFT